MKNDSYSFLASLYGIEFTSYFPAAIQWLMKWDAIAVATSSSFASSIEYISLTSTDESIEESNEESIDESIDESSTGTCVES